MERLIFGCLFWFSIPFAQADLLPIELSLNLRQVPTQAQHYTVLELEIKNESALHGSILIPGYPHLGLGLFEILAFERKENMKWSLDTVYHSFLPDSSIDVAQNIQFWSLAPLESYKQLLVIPFAPIADRAYQVKYQPHVCAEWFSYCFRWHDEEGNPFGGEQIDHDQRFVYQGPFYSALLDEITAKTTEGSLFTTKGMYQDAYLEKWRKVKKGLGRHTFSSLEYPILNKALYSQMVLSSLPSYSFQYYIVETQTGLHYIRVDYRLGKVFKLRGFMAKIAHLCGARRVFWKTSSVHKTKLILFHVAPF